MSKYSNKPRPELKHRDQSTSTPALDSTGVVISGFGTTGMSQGIGVNEYTGKGLLLKNMTVRFNLQANPLMSTVVAVTVRIIIGLYYQASMPAISNILSTVTHLSPYSGANATRYKVYWNKTYTVDLVKNQVQNFVKKVNFGSVKCNFSDTTSAKPMNVQIFIIALSTSTSTNEHPSLISYSRTRYTDP